MRIVLDGDASLFPMQLWPLDKDINELTRDFDLQGFTLHVNTMVLCEPVIRQVNLDWPAAPEIGILNPRRMTCL
jgi:hypothetical protein